MEKKKIEIWILHAGIEHPSPYFYNFCLELNNYENYEYVINPELPLDKITNKGIIYFNRLKRFYDSNDLETANTFLKNVDILKQKGWKIVWTVHNFFPIDRKLTDVDYYVTNEFINKCDLVFSLSEYMKKSIKKHYNINAINHGMGINNFENSKSKLKIKNTSIFTFTFIGNIYKYKMLDDVINSFNKLKNCRLIIAGRESKNANVNIKKLISNNSNIIWINQYIDKNDWIKLTSITNVFISLYDLNTPAFKYGFFPSNFINISRTKIKCISPKSEIIDEMIDSNQMIYFDFNEEDGLYKAMMKALVMKNENNKSYKLKYNYEWNEVVKIFIDNCNKIF
ncbi:MAG: hypothetical protein PUD07_02265 [bacterium]|nr:hypothetical protein [bacterium]